MTHDTDGNGLGFLRRATERTLELARELEAEIDSQRGLLAAQERERHRLIAQLTALEDELAIARARIETSLGSSSAPSADEPAQAVSSPRYQEFSRQVAELANLYVTSSRFHEAEDRAEVMTVVSEVVQSLVGCEMFGQFEYSVGPDGHALSPALVFGLEQELVNWAQSVPTTLVDAMSTGQVVAFERDSAARASLLPEDRIRALVPIRFRGASIGVLVLFELLPHKPALSSADVALLELISTHTATSLRSIDALSREANHGNG